VGEVLVWIRLGICILLFADKFSQLFSFIKTQMRSNLRGYVPISRQTYLKKLSCMSWTLLISLLAYQSFCLLFYYIYEAVDVMNLAQWANASTLQCFGDGLGVTCLSWSTGRFETPTLVVGGAHPIVFRYSETSRQWNSIIVLPPPPVGDVLDVAWAPNVGRRYHYIASAEGKQLRIFKLSRGSDGLGDTLELEATQTIPVSNAWRCQWNVTGTVLACSGDRGIVQMFKSDSGGNFQCVSCIQGDVSQVVAKAS
jgi:nucleoporin SEH1